MPVTIRDVARESETSLATVSRVLNGSMSVHPELRVRVLKAAKQLGYYPDSVGKALRSRRSSLLGCIVSDITNPMFAAIYKAAQLAADQNGYALILANSDGLASQEERYVRLLAQRRVEGVMVSTADESGATLGTLLEARIPVVLLDRESGPAEVDAVLVDDREGMAAATRYLVELGHERIGFLAGFLKVRSGRERRAGFVATAAELGLSRRKCSIVDAEFRTDRARAATIEMLNQPKPPSAIISSNGRMTVGLMQAIYELGVSIPRDLSVVGFDDSEFTRFAHPPLTVISRPIERLGTIAIEMLLDRIAGRATPQPVLARVETELIVRASCGSPRRTDARARRQRSPVDTASATRQHSKVASPLREGRR
ncbi:MAG: LacI family DNA-binding transcriptional regulator [Candidatus Dormiibacterota bacterium]